MHTPIYRELPDPAIIFLILIFDIDFFFRAFALFVFFADRFMPFFLTTNFSYVPELIFSTLWHEHSQELILQFS